MLSTRDAARAAASRAPMSSSPGRSYLPPQPLKPKSRARAVAGDDRAGVAQPDVAERLDHDLGESAASAARGRAGLGVGGDQDHLLAACRRHGPRGRRRRPRRARGSRSSAHSSGGSGKPIHTASCGAHSAGGGRHVRHRHFALRARLLSRIGAEFGGLVPVRPGVAVGELAAEPVIDRQVLTARRPSSSSASYSSCGL